MQAQKTYFSNKATNIKESFGSFIGRKPRVKFTSLEASKEAIIEFSDIRKDLKFLPNIKEEQKALRIKILEDKIKLDLARLEHNVKLLNFKINKVSFSKVSSFNSVSNGKVVYSPSWADEPINFNLISTKSCRQDFTMAFYRQKYERQQARELCEAIARRFYKENKIKSPKIPFLKITERDRTDEIDRAARKQYWARVKAGKRPVEVETWSPECTHVGYVPSLDISTKEEEVVRKWPLSRSPKTQRRGISSYNKENKKLWKSYEEKTPQVELPRTARGQIKFSPLYLARQLSGTTMGQNLFVGLAQVWMIRKNFKTYEQFMARHELNYPTCQMDTETAIPVEDNPIEIKGSVALQLQPAEDHGRNIPGSSGFKNISVSYQTQTYDTIVDRWLQIDTFVWGSEVRDQNIKTYKMPWIVLKENKDAPGMQIFYSHRFWRGDLKFKFVLNSNQFQVGALMISWLYKSRESDEYKNYRSIYSASQRNHCILNAGSSNNAELSVSYHNFDSMMLSGPTETNLGELYVDVLNILQSGVASANTCNVTVFISFENIEFFCNISRSLGLPQMFKKIASLTNTATDVLNVLDADLNRDNPCLPITPQVFMPQTISSFCTTDFTVEPVNVLRADPRGQTPHPYSSYDMGLDYAKVFGFYSSFEWSTNLSKNSKLYVENVTPILALDSYPTFSRFKNQLTATTFPPIAVVSSFFGYWRGDIEYKIQIIASKFHTGTLMITFVPGNDLNDDYDINILKLSHSEIIDISSTREFTFRAPWYSVNAWKRTRGLSTFKDVSTGKLFVKVLNPLICVAQVVNSLTCNVFVRAADNFELAIPRLTHIVPAFEKAYSPPKNQFLDYYNTSCVWYLSKAARVTIGTNPLYSCVVLTSHNISNGFTGFYNVKPFVVYQMFNYPGYEMWFPTTMNYYNGKEIVSEMYTPKYFTYHPNLSTPNAQGIIAWRDKDKALEAMGMIAKNPSLFSALAFSHQCYMYKVDGNWSMVKGPNDAKMRLCTPSDPLPIFEEFVPEDADYVVIPNSDDEPVPVTIVKPSRSTGMGMRTFGESTPDLKSLCRRWIHYTSILTVTCDKLNPQDCVYTARFPIHPYRALNVKTTFDFANRVREGTISTIASGFYKFRGGIRLRAIVLGIIPDGACIYIQHRFDENLEKDDIQYGTTAKSTLDLLSTQYSTYVQELSVNPSFTIEIPYYKEYEALSSIRIKDRKVVTLGSLYVWAYSPKSQNIQIEFYYSLADDAMFSVRQGFPAMYDLTEEVPEAQMDEDEQADAEWVEAQRTAQDICVPEPLVAAEPIVEPPVAPTPPINATPPVVAVAPTSVEEEGFGYTVGQIMAYPFKKTWDGAKYVGNKIKSTVEYLNESAKSVDSILKDFKDSSSTNLPKTSGFFGFFTNNISKGFLIVSHLMQAYWNATGKSLALALVSIYIELFGISFAGFASLGTQIIKIWNGIRGVKASTEQPQAQSNHENDGDVRSYASAMYGIIASTLRITNPGKPNLSNIENGLFSVATSARESSFVGKFIEDNITLVKRVWTKVVELFSFDKAQSEVIKSIQDENLQKWCIEVEALTSTQVKEKVFAYSSWSTRVFELLLAGKVFMFGLLNSKTPLTNNITQYVVNLNKKLTDLESEMINRKCYSPIRYVPFCVWLTGDPGVGKSCITNKLAEKMATLAGSSVVPSYYSLNTTNKYFDGFNNQPTVVIDDFCSTSIATNPEAYAQFLLMKSNALFNPSFSKIEDKTKLINFQNLIVTSNMKYLVPTPGIEDVSAFNRRRDIVVDMRLRHPKNPEQKITYTEALALYSKDQILNGDYFTAIAYNDPIDASKGYRVIPRVEGISYMDSVEQFIMSSAKQYHANEMEQYLKRWNDLNARLEGLQKSDDSMQDYLNCVYKAFSESDNSFVGLKLNSSIDSYIKRCQESCTYNIKTSVESIIKSSKAEAQSDQQELIYAMAATCSPTTSVKVENNCLVYSDGTREKKWKLSDLNDIYENQYKSIEKKSDYFVFDKIEKDLFMQIPLIPSEVKSKNDAIKSVPSNLMCLHKMLQDEPNVVYADNVWYNSSGLDIKGGAPAGCCYFRYKSKFYAYPECTLFHPSKAIEFRRKLQTYVHFSKVVTEENGQKFVNWCKNPGVVLRAEYDNLITYAPIVIWQTFLPEINSSFEDIADPSKGLPPHIKRDLLLTTNSVERIFNRYVPKRSIWEKLVDPTWYMDFLKIAGLVAFILLAFKKIMSFVNMFFSSRAEPNIHPSGDYVNIKNIAKSEKSLKLVPQATENSGDQMEINNENIKQKIIGNSFMMYAKNADKTKYILPARCLGLKARTFVILKHYYEIYIANGISDLYFNFGPKGQISYPIHLLEYQWTEEGYGIATFPKSFPHSFKDIIKYMPSDSSRFTPPYFGKLVTVNLDKVDEEVLPLQRINHPIHIAGSSSHSAWKITLGVEYEKGGKGLCGSFVFCDKLAHPLVAIHTSGIGNKVGYAEMLYRETFQKLPNAVEYRSLELQPAKEIIVPQSDYFVEGKVESKMAIIGSLKSKIEPSIIQGVFPISTEPAPLSKFDSRLNEQIDPFEIGVQKRFKHPIYFDKKDQLLAKEHLNIKILKTVKPLRPLTDLSIVQAVEGFDLTGYEKMAFSTSEGYPWVKSRPKGYTDKSWMFNLSEYPNGSIKVDGIEKTLLEKIKDDTELRRKGIVPTTVFTFCLKDARILKEKIPIPGKTRIFEISPIDLTIVQRQHFMDYIASYQSARFEAENTIGINCDGPEWSLLANRLLSFSSCILTADYSGYGPGLNKEVLLDCFEISRNWYKKFQPNISSESLQIKNTIGYEVANGLHIAKDTIYRPTSGLPSGNCETVEKNSMCNSIYIRIAFLGLARQYSPNYENLKYFDKFILLFHNGDDLIIAVKPDIIEWFNNLTLIEFFSWYNIKMTDALKSGEVKKYCSIYEATYLKRGFVPHPFRTHQWLAPLEKSSVLDTANWIWRSPNRLLASQVNSEMCCRLAYTLGENEYNNICRIIHSKWSDLGYYFSYPKWIQLDKMVWDQAEGPSFSFSK